MDRRLGIPDRGRQVVNLVWHGPLTHLSLQVEFLVAHLLRLRLHPQGLYGYLRPLPLCAEEYDPRRRLPDGLGTNDLDGRIRRRYWRGGQRVQDP